MAETLNVTRRETTGSNAMKKVRRAGLIPANLFGHGQDNVNLSIRADEWDLALRRGAKLLALAGDLDETALINKVQWDHLGTTTLHVDLIRISAHEKVATSVNIEIRGEAAGTKQGGSVHQVLRQLDIECAADSIPASIPVNVSELEVGGSITIADVTLPEGTILVTPAETVIVVCTEVLETEEDEEASGVAGLAEPEVIGGKPEEDSDD